MSSQVVVKDKKYTGAISQMAKSIQQVVGKIDTVPDGLYDQKVTIKTGDVTIKNDDLDFTFSVPFDDDTEANEAEIVVYNLTDKTINAMKKKAKITITAGYGKDTGVIFSGHIKKKRTRWEDNDKVTTIWAIDDNGKEESELSEMSFGGGTKASKILNKLVGRVGLPIAVFKVRRDHTYKDKVTVSGGLMQNIQRFAEICGVVAYVCKSRIYVCPLTYGTHQTFNLTANTGLLSVSEFEEEIKAENYTDHIKGLDIEMLLQHRVQTGSIINITSKNYKGEYRVKEGTHTYDGNALKTAVKAISYSCLKK